MKYACVIPYAYKPYYDEFVKTCKLENVLAIDNTDLKTNLGIMKSHNMGIEFMRQLGADWLIVMSAGIRFGEAGGLDFVEQLGNYPDALLIHGSGMWVENGTGIEKRQALGWHLTAFRKEVFDVVGGWDENFTPYSLDDTDLTLRMLKGFGDKYKIEVADCDMRHASTSHSISKAGVKAHYPPRHEYFKRKWGREGGEWQNDGYAHPFNNPDLPLSYCPTPDEPLSIWQNEYKKGYNFND